MPLLRLTRRNTERIAKLIRHDIRKTEREVARSTYVPPPGKFHAGQVELANLLRLLEQFEDALDTHIQVWEDEEIVDD